MKRHLAFHRAFAAPVAFLILSACGDTVEPADDLLDGLDEMAIYMAMAERVTAFNHTAEANANLRLALGSAIPPAQPIPAELFGRILAYDVDSDEWRSDPASALPDDVLRVTWHEISGPFVAVPVVVRGYIDLARRDEPDPDLTRLDVRAVRTDGTQRTLADYVARFGTMGDAQTRVTRFHATGNVSDGERPPLNFDTRRETLERTAGGGSGGATAPLTEPGTRYQLQLANQGFAYATVLEETSPTGSGTSVVFEARATVGGVETRVELALQEPPGAQLTGSGAVRHAGRKIADVQVTGTTMTFHRPDGTAFRSIDQDRLGDLVSILFIPISVVEPYFS
jgi:hypothetical protein